MFTIFSAYKQNFQWQLYWSNMAIFTYDVEEVSDKFMPFYQYLHVISIGPLQMKWETSESSYHA